MPRSAAVRHPLAPLLLLLGAVAGCHCQPSAAALRARAGPRCDADAGGCLPRPYAALSLDVVGLRGLAVGKDGAVYVAGTVLPPGRNFGPLPVEPAGQGDVLVARYDGDPVRPRWVRALGNGLRQEAGALAVTDEGTVIVAGEFLGSLGGDGVELVGSASEARPFLVGLRGSDGRVLWAKSPDVGPGGEILAVSAQPGQDRVVVCGAATRAATELVPGATYGGGPRDGFLAVFDGRGKRLWARQLAGSGYDDCTAAAFDDRGQVIATGQYSERLAITSEPLRLPEVSGWRWLWLATFDGRTGRPISQASFGEGPGNQRPYALAVAPAAPGQIVLGGSMTTTLPFGGRAQPLQAVLRADAFVARLDARSDPPFAGLWAVSLGSPLIDETRDVAFDAWGDVIATGFYSEPTAGAAALPSTLPGSKQFILSLDGKTGATRGAVGYGDREMQVGSRVAVGAPPGRAPFVVLGGDYAGTRDYGDAGTLQSPGGSFLLFAR